MKKIVVLILAVVFLAAAGCADSKQLCDGGICTTYEPYGVANKELRDESVVYEVCTGNVVVAVLFSGSLLLPVYLIGWQLYEPVSLKENVAPLCTELVCL